MKRELVKTLRTVVFLAIFSEDSNTGKSALWSTRNLLTCTSGQYPKLPQVSECYGARPYLTPYSGASSAGARNTYRGSS
jgi:hypothetical protein